jgi:hypothetical protein
LEDSFLLQPHGQSLLHLLFWLEPNHPSTIMKMVKERTRTMSAVNDERRHVLPFKVIWDGTIDRFEVFRNNVEGHYVQISAGYFFTQVSRKNV